MESAGKDFIGSSLSVGLSFTFVGLDLGRYAAREAGTQLQKLRSKAKPPAMALRQPPRDASPAEDIELDIEAAAPVSAQEIHANNSVEPAAKATSKVICEKEQLQGRMIHSFAYQQPSSSIQRTIPSGNDFIFTGQSMISSRSAASIKCILGLWSV